MTRTTAQMIDELNAMNAKVHAEIKRIKAEYRTIAQASGLMKKHGARSFNEAFHMEAVARVSA